jgi:hypothetical protein
MPSDRPRTLEEIAETLRRRLWGVHVYAEQDALILSALREAEARGRAQAARAAQSYALGWKEALEHRALFSPPPGSREPGAGGWTEHVERLTLSEAEAAKVDEMLAAPPTTPAAEAAAVKCGGCPAGTPRAGGRVDCADGYGHGIDSSWSCGERYVPATVSAIVESEKAAETERLLRRAAEAASLHEREALNLDSVAHSMTLAKSERFRARQKRDEHRAIAKALRALLDAPPPRRTGGGR